MGTWIRGYKGFKNCWPAGCDPARYPLFANPDGSAIGYRQAQAEIKRLYPDSQRHNTRSLRKGGSTAAMATGCSSSALKVMGNWTSAAHLLYPEGSLQMATEVAKQMSQSTSIQLQSSAKEDWARPGDYQTF